MTIYVQHTSPADTLNLPYATSRQRGAYWPGRMGMTSLRMRKHLLQAETVLRCKFIRISICAAILNTFFSVIRKAEWAERTHTRQWHIGFRN
jgi:hypothetical protein